MNEAKIEIVSVTPGDPIEGDAVAVKYRIVNRTSDVLVFGGGRSEYGRVARRDDGAVHDTMAQQASAPVFYSASQFLLPGATLEREWTVEVFDPALSVAPPLASIAAAEFRAYVPEGSDEMRRRFRGVGLDAFRPAAGAQVILFEKGSPVALAAKMTLKLQPRSYPLAEAKKRFGEAPDAVRWSKLLGGWLFGRRARAAIVKKDAVTELPAGSFAVMSDYEAGKESFEFRLADPQKTDLSKMFQTKEGDGMYRQGTFIEVPRERLMEVLQHAREEKLEVGQVFYFFSNYFFEFRARG